MVAKVVRFIFFGNYFIGLLAIALTIEATLQLRLPFNSLAYYALIFCALWYIILMPIWVPTGSLVLPTQE
jgi:hypothetical protein